MNINQGMKKTNLFGKPVNSTGSTNPFASPLTQNTNNNTLLQPLQPQSTSFPLVNNKNPFGMVQPNEAKTGAQTFSNSNPFAKVYQDTNNGTITSTKPLTSPFNNTSDQNMAAMNANSFFKQPTTNSTLLNNQISHMFNKNGTQQTSTPGTLSNNPQNVSSNPNNVNKFFGGQGQSQTNGFQQQGIFGNQPQQNAIFGNTQPQNTIGLNSQQPNVFNPTQQSQLNQQQNSFVQAQPSFFGQQQNPQNMQVQQHHQNINMSNALSQYLHLYKQHIGQKHPFQNAMPGQPHDPQVNYQFNPQEPNGDYYMFLNNLVSNESIRRNATPWEIFDFAENWANRVNQKKNQQKQTLQQEDARKEINKLFDVKINPSLYQLKMKELPPIQFTMDFLNKLNDPFSCKIMVSQLWFRLKERYSVLMNSLKDVLSHGNHIKIKELPYYKQILVMRKQIQSLVQKVVWLKQKDKEIKKDQYECASTFKQVLKKYKNAFAQANISNKMLQSSNLELEQMIDYIERNLKLIFKAYVQNQSTSFQDPDEFMLQTTQLIAKQLNGLDKMIDDHLAIETNTQQSTDFLELAQNICNFYDQIAAKLYTVREKMKKMIQIVAQNRSYSCYQELQNKIEEKAKEVISRKMIIYNRIRDIEDILEGKSKVEENKQNKAKIQQRLKMAREDMFSLQEMRPKHD